MKRVLLSLLALAAAFSGTAQAQDKTYVLVPTLSPGVTRVKVEMFRTDLTLKDVQAQYIAEGESGLTSSFTDLRVYVGPSTSKVNPLLDISDLAPSGGMVVLEPVAGLDTVEVSMEVEQSPVRTAWKLPMLGAADFFAPGSTVYVTNLVKAADAASSLQLFNAGARAATCSVQVLRPKGSLIEERDGISVPPVGVIRIADVLSHVAAATAEGLKAAVSCNQPFYALGAYPATNRWNTRVQYPVERFPRAGTAVTLDSRPGVFLHVSQGNSNLDFPVNLDPTVTYHTLAIDFDVAVKDPPDFVVFRNVIGMYRHGGRRFHKTLFFGSFENFSKQKYVVDLGSPFIETTLKRNFPLVGGQRYHFSIKLSNDERSLHYLITDAHGGIVMDLLGGLYNDFNVVDGQGPNVQMGLGGVADNAYFPPYGWDFANLSIVATR
jgi:hypothetical protein